MPTRLTRISVIAGLLLALAAGLGLALWPCAYQGVEAQSTQGGAGEERQLCATLVEMNGVDVLGVLALPVLLAGVGLVAVHAGRRSILLTVVVALVAFCLLALASPPVGGPAVPTSRGGARHRGGRLATTAKRSALRLTTKQPDKCGWCQATVPMKMGCVNVNTGSACVPGRDPVGDHGVHGHIVSATISTIVPRCRPDAAFAPKQCNLG